MRFERVVVVMAGCLLLTVPASAQQPPSAPSATGPPPWDAGVSNPVPALGMILDLQKELGLSGEQIESLERLGLDVLRDGIRRQAELAIAQLELSALLDRAPDEPIDVKSAEAKIQDVERLRSELAVLMVRAVEAAKNQLTPEQRVQLIALSAPGDNGNPDASDPSNSPDAARVGNPAPPGGGARPPGGGQRPPSGGSHPRPPGVGQPRPPGSGHAPPRGGQHPAYRGSSRAFIGVRPYWWGGLYGGGLYSGAYSYWRYSAPIVVQPPAYIEQPPAVYWYYCPSAGTFYPAVQSCPDPWILVAPSGG